MFKSKSYTIELWYAIISVPKYFIFVNNDIQWLDLERKKTKQGIYVFTSNWGRK